MSHNDRKNTVLCSVLSSGVADQGRGALPEIAEGFGAQTPQQVVGLFSEAVPQLGSTWTQDMSINRQGRHSQLHRGGPEGL